MPWAATGHRPASDARWLRRQPHRHLSPGLRPPTSPPRRRARAAGRATTRPTSPTARSSTTCTASVGRSAWPSRTAGCTAARTTTTAPRSAGGYVGPNNSNTFIWYRLQAHRALGRPPRPLDPEDERREPGHHHHGRSAGHRDRRQPDLRRWRPEPAQRPEPAGPRPLQPDGWQLGARGPDGAAGRRDRGRHADDQRRGRLGQQRRRAHLLALPRRRRHPDRHHHRRVVAVVEAGPAVQGLRARRRHEPHVPAHGE